LLIPLAGAVLGFLDGYRGAELALQTLPYVLILLGIGVGLYLLSPALQVRARAKNGWGEAMRIRLNESGVHVLHPTQTTLFHWEAIKDVIVRRDRLFLFTTPACAIVLPRRVFDSDVQFEEWSERAERYRQTAKPS
jgi:hypothetical protein